MRKQEMGNGGRSLHSTMFCLMENKVSDNPFHLIPGQTYFVAYLRRGLESRNEQHFQLSCFPENCRITNWPLFISTKIEGMQLIALQ